VTASTILLGGTAPLTGPAAASAAYARGAKAYFDSVNATGGVAGRRIEYLVLDDAGEPAQSLAATRALVEEEQVFALVNSYGTEQNLATRAYLNRRKLPQLFVASGATTWGRDAARYPWSIGFQPSHRAEGWVYGRFVAKTMRRARIAVLYENDALGKELLQGLRRGLARAGSSVVAAERYDETSLDVQPQIARLRASGATVLGIFARSPVAREAAGEARRLGWRPSLILSSESGVPGNEAVEGSVSATFLKDPGDRRWRQDPGISRYRAIMARHAHGANLRNLDHVYGMAVAYETVALVERLGATPTRTGLMAAARSLNDPSNPFLLPGISVRTGKNDGFPVQQVQLRRSANGKWIPAGGLWQTNGR